MAYLGNRGYTIPKSSLTDAQLEQIKTELTVKPFIPAGYAPPTDSDEFAVFGESKTKLYLPIQYGIEKLGLPAKNKMSAGADMRPECVFAGALRPEQMAPVIKATNLNNLNGNGGIITLPCGGGKCMAPDTLIRTAAGRAVQIQNVDVGDLIMGDDSRPRRVLSKCWGEAQMYDVVNELTGGKYTVNADHILCLRRAKDPSTVVEISVADYLTFAERFPHDIDLLGYKMATEYPFIHTDLEPYILGHYLGDPFLSIINYDKKIALLRRYSITPFYVPDIFKYNSLDVRLRILAGLMDQIAEINTEFACYELYFDKSKMQLIEDVREIANSLGFCTQVIGRVRYGIPHHVLVIYYEGAALAPPFKNKALARDAATRYAAPFTTYPISIVENNTEKEYCGFELTGNGRYVLADYTVTHNTVIGLNIATTLRKKTLIIVHKGFLVNQWAERIAQFVPGARVGTIQQKKVDTVDKDIVIGMLQSIAMREYDEAIFHEFGTCIIDECHRIPCKVFSQALRKINSVYMFGLSATPSRPDGLFKVLKWFIGDIIFQEKKRENADVALVERYLIDSDDADYKQDLQTYMRKPNLSVMLNNIANYEARSLAIVAKCVELLATGRKILLLSDRRDHLDYISAQMPAELAPQVGFYRGGMKDAALKVSENCRLILGTYAMASTGMDIPGLNTLVLASPKSASNTFQQSLGRIFRKKHTETRALIVDYVDVFSAFYGQGRKRLDYYRKHLYEVCDYKLTLRRGTTAVIEELKVAKVVEEVVEEPTKCDILDFLL